MIPNIFLIYVSICFFPRFIIYKLPKFRIGEVGSGVEYMYLDSAAGSWQRSKFMVNTTQGAMANTLNQLYKGKVYMVRSAGCQIVKVLIVCLWNKFDTSAV